MDFGVFLPVSGRASAPKSLIDAARHAEELGFQSVWAADRIVIPWQIDTHYAYNWSGAFFVPPEAPFLEPLTALAFLAGCTQRLRLGISVLVLPYRDPVYWSKVVATIDYLSAGRFILSVRVGWMSGEFAGRGEGALFHGRRAAAGEHLA